MTLTRSASVVCAILLSLTALCEPLRSRTSEPRASQAVTARLVTGVDSVSPGSTIMVGLHLRMKPRWHTYWLNPGDSGLPTKFGLALPGATIGEVRWPLPEQIAAGPLMSYGYEGETVLLREVRLPADLPAGSVTLSSLATWLECADVCLPGKAELSLELPVTASPRVNDRDQRLLLKYEKRVPQPLPAHWRVEESLSAEGLRLRISGAPELTTEYFFPGPALRIDFAAKQSHTRTGSALEITIKPDPAAPRPDALSGVLAARVAGTTVGYEIGRAPGQDGLGFWTALAFAFLGGLILNLMPCVLPVLSLKVNSIVQHAGDSRARSLLHGLVLTTGVLVSFWAIAAAILVGRAGGETLGWGFQLQSPPIVVALTLLMGVFSLNLVGLFEVGTSLQQAGTHQQSGFLGSFMTGVLAVIVAAPCTAPFMGAALGYALLQPAFAALAIFTALGLGLALPYIVLSAFPGLTRVLPRPGPWMVTLKQTMGFLMLAAVVWLVWVLGRISGVDAMAWLLAALLALGVAAWIYGRAWQAPMGWRDLLRRRWVAPLLVVFVAAAGWLGTRAALAEPAPSSGSGKAGGLIEWRAYSPEALARLRAAGTPVFLDFTADWCLSCKVNEQTALETKTVRDALARHGVVAMQADWTRRDPQISAMIRSFGRSGVPLYVVYPAGTQRPPFLLPEVLTESMVLRALERAASR